MKLNPNCSETVWKLTNVNPKGPSEYRIDSSSSPEFPTALSNMIFLLQSATNVNEVDVKVLDQQGSWGPEHLRLILRYAKKVVKGEMTQEEAERKLTKYEDNYHG